MDRLYNMPPRKKGGHIFYIHWKENVNRRCRLDQGMQGGGSQRLAIMPGACEKLDKNASRELSRAGGPMRRGGGQGLNLAASSCYCPSLAPFLGSGKMRFGQPGSISASWLCAGGF